MAGVFGYSREAVRVKVQCEGVQPEYRKFSVDPQITSFEVLQSIIAKAFDLKGEFTVSYRAIDDYGQETYLSLLSDWDLDAAFLSASEPCLGLHIEAKPFHESIENWNDGADADVDIMPSIQGLEALRLPQLQMQQFQGATSHSVRSISHQQPQQAQSSTSKIQHRLPGLILNQVERTFSMVQRALNLGEESQAPMSALPPRQPLTDAEFRKFLDPIGQVVQDRELRTVIYYGGIEPSLRKVVWKHILNVYPDGMSGKERMDYMKKKAHEYCTLRDYWREIIQKGEAIPDLSYVTSMVRKDVLRTDRHHPFYAGSDDNQNIASLFNILTTYALNHPSVSYCQGMSDLASPLLVTMGDEAHAYICFCALMRRLCPNFMLDGEAMTLRFQHLSDGLMFYDPEFYTYLKSHQADDLLFCYRWLLLEMKREFAFDDALRMMEVMWSSLSYPEADSKQELPLYDALFAAPPLGLTPPPISPLLKSPRENAYTKVCALRRQGSAASLMSRNKLKSTSTHRQNQSLDETISGRDKTFKEKVKPYASLDDSSLLSVSSAPGEAHASSMERGEKKEQLADFKNAMLSRATCSPTDGAGVTRSGSSIRSHLKEKFQSGRCRNLLLSLEKLDRQHDFISEESHCKKEDNTRVVKNLNEFLNFTNLNKKSSPQKCKVGCSSLESDRIGTQSGEYNSGIPLKNNDTDDDESLKGSNSSFVSDKNVIEDSSPDDSDYYPMTTLMTQELRLELDNLDRKVFGGRCTRHSVTSDDTEDTESAYSESIHQESESDTTFSNHGSNTAKQQCNQNCGGDDVFIWENPLKASPMTPDEQTDLEQDNDWHSTPKSNLSVRSHINKTPSSAKSGCDDFTKANTYPLVSSTSNHIKSSSSAEPGVVITCSTNCEEAIDLSSVKTPSSMQPSRLPPPSEFGGGNPFLMFLCLTVLRQHRDYIMHSNMDYNEVAMHFDKMVRKHDVTRVLNQARHMFAAYLKQYNNNNSGSAENCGSVDPGLRV